MDADTFRAYSGRWGRSTFTVRLADYMAATHQENFIRNFKFGIYCSI
jgi:hypothetical protein